MLGLCIMENTSTTTMTMHKDAFFAVVYITNFVFISAGVTLFCFLTGGRRRRVQAKPILVEDQCTICEHNLQALELPCTHRLCKTCLEKMDDHELMACPWCRAKMKEEEEP